MAKAVDQNALDGEGRKLGERTGLDMELRAHNFTKDPGSPSCKRCGLGVGTGTSRLGAAGKPLSPPPGKYGRKAEILRANCIFESRMPNVLPLTRIGLTKVLVNFLKPFVEIL